MVRSKLKQRILARLEHRLSPSIFLYTNPLKIQEYRVLSQLADLKHTDQVIDLGCGAGKQTYCIARKVAKVIGIDPDGVALERAKQSASKMPSGLDISFHEGMLEESDISDNWADTIISFSVIEHIPQLDTTLRACFQKLKTGGHIVLSTDSERHGLELEQMDQHTTEHHILRRFTPEGLGSVLKRAGFRDVRVEHILSSDYAKKLFLQGLVNGFAWGWSKTLFAYSRLAMAERAACSKDTGLFLVASAVK